MKKLPLILFLAVLSFSCSNFKKSKDDHSAPRQVILNIKNDSNTDVTIKLKNKDGDLSVTIRKDSIYEIIVLADSCNLIHETLNKKYDYLSYQKGDSLPEVLVDKSINKVLTISDLYPLNGCINLNMNDGKTTVEKFVGVISVR